MHKNYFDDSCTIIFNSFSLKKLYQMDDVYFKIEPLYTLKCPFYWTANMRYYSQKFRNSKGKVDCNVQVNFRWTVRL